MMTKLFIIDDDPICQAIAQQIITDCNLFDEWISFSKARTSLDYLILNQGDFNALPDVILLDLNMPEMSGWDFLCIFEDLLPFLSKKVGVFIVSSSVDPNDKFRSKIYPFVEGFIPKPLSISNFVDISNYVSINAMTYENIRNVGSLLTSSLLSLNNKSNFSLMALRTDQPNVLRNNHV